MKSQHPLIKSLVDRYRNLGVAIYAGKTFTVATWENGERLEFKVDRNINNPIDTERR
jgi:hypothetical protein